jgi:hypothetical protein
VPFNFTRYIDDATSLVNKSIISMSRIDDAVSRILQVKFTMGLFENPLADLSFADQLGKKVDRLTPYCIMLVCQLWKPMYITHSLKFDRSTGNWLEKLSGNHSFY